MLTKLVYTIVQDQIFVGIFLCVNSKTSTDMLAVIGIFSKHLGVVRCGVRQEHIPGN